MAKKEQEPKSETEQDVEKVYDKLSPTEKKWARLKAKAVDTAVKQLLVSSKFKKERMKTLKGYEEIYAGNIPRRMRQLFNVPIPIFPGIVDTILADFNQPIELRFEERHPADYFVAQKVTAAWRTEKDSTRPEARWNQKMRWDRFNAVISGRGIMLYYAESDPQYNSVLATVNYNDFHCQPKGGGQLENHLFCGQEGIFKSVAELKKGVRSGIYDAAGVKNCIDLSQDEQYENRVESDLSDRLARFRALDQDTEMNSYVGEEMVNLCQWGLTIDNVRYYLLFEPWTKSVIRFCKLTDIYPADLWPWVSWATHENDKVFWSKSFADDIAPIADSIITLFNQELTNREKKNFGARAYDKDMFPDEGKLDAAQFRPDALVPADTKQGAKRIADGVYRFDVAELSGTVDLVSYMSKDVKENVGVGGGSTGSADAGKKPTVVLAEQQQLSKRVGLRNASYTEMWGEVGVRYVFGLRDNMGETMAIRMLGPVGFDWDELMHDELEGLKKDLEIRVISSTEQENMNRVKIAARVESLDKISSNKILAPHVNAAWLAEHYLRDVGGWDESEISIAMDTTNYGGKEIRARAVQVIQKFLLDEKPEKFYGATSEFMQIILDYATDHHTKLGEAKFHKFMDYIDEHSEIAALNMKRKAGKMKMAGAGAAMASPADGGQGAPNDSAAPKGAQ